MTDIKRILGLASLIVASVVIWGAGATPAAGQQGFRLELDGNLQNGVCDPVDSDIAVPPGQEFQVAVCLFDPEEPPDAFQLHLRYDRRFLSAPEREDVPPALDDNPDANAGDTTFGSVILGNRWDCTAFGVLFPQADFDQTEFADAIIVCNANIASPDTQITRAGALAAITFVAEREGETEVTFEPNNQIAGATRTVYTCGEIPTQTIPCRSLTVRISSDAPPPPPTTSGGATPRSTEPAPDDAAATATGRAEETTMGTDVASSPTPAVAESDDDGDGLEAWVIASIAAGVVAILALAAGGYLLYRRRAGGRAQP